MTIERISAECREYFFTQTRDSTLAMLAITLSGSLIVARRSKNAVECICDRCRTLARRLRRFAENASSGRPGLRQRG